MPFFWRKNLTDRLPGHPRRSYLSAAAWLLVFSAPVLGQNGGSREYQIKAAFLLNFIQFIQWPPEAFPEADSPVVIGVLGDDPFGAVLEQTLGGEVVGNRTLVVRRSRDLSELKSAQLLFISASEQARFEGIVEALGNRPVVSVGEFRGFTSRGGMIGFYIENNKVRFEINAAAAQKRGIRINAQLLARARVVGPDPGGGHP